MFPKNTFLTANTPFFSDFREKKKIASVRLFVDLPWQTENQSFSRALVLGDLEGCTCFSVAAEKETGRDRDGTRLENGKIVFILPTRNGVESKTVF